jgi:probable HAF family extracellular repeat protein
LTGDLASHCYAINELWNNDQVAGSSENTQVVRALLYEHVAGQNPEYFDIDTVNASTALGLNSLYPSDVVGYVGDSTQPWPTLWQKDAPPASLASVSNPSDTGRGMAYAVNNYRVIAGWSDDGAGNNVACFWSPSAWHARSLRTLGGPSSEARAINDSGNLAGLADVAPGTSHAFLWNATDSKMTDLHMGPGTSEAHGINMFDEVVGQLDPGTGAAAQAFRWTADNGMHPLSSLPKATGASAEAINDLGVAVGWCTHFGSGRVASSSAVMWSGENVVDLTAQILQNPGWHLEVAAAINNRGQIAGTGIFRNGVRNGLLLTPVKVPFAFAAAPAIGSPAPPPRPASEVDPEWSVNVDGGMIAVSPTGALIHISTPRPDPQPMTPSPRSFEHLAELLYGRHPHERAGELSRAAAHLAPELVDRHVQAVVDRLAAREGEDR